MISLCRTELWKTHQAIFSLQVHLLTGFLVLDKQSCSWKPREFGNLVVNYKVTLPFIFPIKKLMKKQSASCLPSLWTLLSFNHARAVWLQHQLAV